MRLARDGNRVVYSSRRLLSRARVEFRGAYWPDGPVREAEPGSLEHFLTDRYCLYTQTRDGRLERLEIQHAPWPLQAAGADIDTNTVAAAQGITLPGDRPILHFSRRLDVVGWLSETISSLPVPLARR
jgi:uncharacterized protein YqjF (DUF2071 family)